MRIISGRFKGRTLLTIKDKSVRPTAGRVREAIFSILTSKDAIIGAKVLDLFCGSGALGIEAISRGAKHAVFIEKNAAVAKIARENLAKLGLDFSVYNTDFELALKKLQGQSFDLIFLDPPYFDNLESRCLFLIQKYDILSQNGIIVLEHFAKKDLSDLAKGFIIDRRDFGRVSVLFLTKEKN